MTEARFFGLPLMVTVHRAHDIVTTLRVAREFNVRLVLDGASEAYLVIHEFGHHFAGLLTADGANHQQVLDDVFWAVLNSREFLFNH